MKPLKLNKINTEIDWTQWTIGASFFIPAFYPEGVLKDLKKYFETEFFDWTYRIQIEDGMLGIRVWRVR